MQQEKLRALQHLQIQPACQKDLPDTEPRQTLQIQTVEKKKKMEFLSSALHLFFQFQFQE